MLQHVDLNPESTVDPKDLIRFLYPGTYTGSAERPTGLNLAGKGIKNADLEKLWEGDLSELVSLNLAENELTQFTLPGEQLPSLRFLDLSENKALRTLRIEGSLPALEKLDASECALDQVTFTQVPLENPLPILEHLDLRKNQLASIDLPDGMAALVYLDLSENQLSALELGGNWPALTYVFLQGNGLENLSFGDFPTHLETLHLRDNHLKDLPPGLLTLEKPENFSLYLHNNPFEQIPKQLIHEEEYASSWKAVRNYLREFEEETIINDKVKIIIVGNGRVGKTSLMKVIQDKHSFNPKEPFTHGVQLGVLHKKDLPEVKTERLRANIWDFGGQEIFYATHQFFLTEDALYILVWTAEENVKEYREADERDRPKDEKWREKDYWLENIVLHGKQSPILMVQSHTDKQKTSIDTAWYEQNYQADCLDTSAERYWGIDELKAKISEVLNERIHMFGQKFPASYHRVIDRIESLKQQDPTLTLDEYMALCRKIKMKEGSEMDEMELLDYLRRTGLVVYFREPKVLSQTLFIDPNWLTRQSYALFSNDLIEKKGEFDRPYLKQCLQKHFEKHPDTSSPYPPVTDPEIDQFLALMINFQLIFPHKTKEGVYVAPHYLPEKLDEVTQAFRDILADKLKRSFVFRFPRFLPDNVMINFLSEYGPYSQENYWKNGIIFKDQHKTTCLVELDPKTRSLSVYFDEVPMAQVLSHEICQAFVGFSRSANAEVSLDGHHFVSWQDLQRISEKGGTEIESRDGSQILPVEAFAHLLGKWGPEDIPAGKGSTALRGEFKHGTHYLALSEKKKMPQPAKADLEKVWERIGSGRLIPAMEELLPWVSKEQQEEIFKLKGRVESTERDFAKSLISLDEKNRELAKVQEVLHRIITEYEKGAMALVADNESAPVTPPETGSSDEPSPPPIQSPARIFFMYSSEDEAWRKELETHFAPLERRKKVKTWYDRKILPGDEWDVAIKEKLNEADIILLLLSADFMCVDYIWETELEIAKKRSRQARIVPVFLSACDTEGLWFVAHQGAGKGQDWIAEEENKARRASKWQEVIRELKRLLPS